MLREQEGSPEVVRGLHRHRNHRLGTRLSAILSIRRKELVDHLILVPRATVRPAVSGVATARAPMNAAVNNVSILREVIDVESPTHAHTGRQQQLSVILGEHSHQSIDDTSSSRHADSISETFDSHTDWRGIVQSRKGQWENCVESVIHLTGRLKSMTTYS